MKGRKDILDSASELIDGERERDYGDAYMNHLRIAKGWNPIIEEAMLSHGKVTPAHVALMMDWVKTARLLNTLDHKDSWVDKAGYTALGYEFSHRDAHKKLGTD